MVAAKRPYDPQMDRTTDDEDPRLAGEPRSTVDWGEEGFDEDTEPAGDDVGTI